MPQRTTRPLLAPQDIQKIEAFLSAKNPLLESLWMEHAALAALGRLQLRFSSLLPGSCGLFLVGPGKNGADALALARLLLPHHARIDLVEIPNPQCVPLATQKKLLEDLLSHFPLSQVQFLNRFPEKELLEGKYDYMMDGLWGGGLNREIPPIWQTRLRLLNQLSPEAHPYTISLDVPTGLDGRTGQIRGEALRADETVVMGFDKSGLWTGQAANFTGLHTLASLGFPEKPPEALQDSPKIELLLSPQFPDLPPAIHKGHRGHVYVMGGAPEQEGASVLSALGALAMGAGKVTWVGAQRSSLLPPTIMWQKQLKPEQLGPQDRVVLGPGFGMTSSHMEQLLFWIDQKCPLLLDADALHLLSQDSKKARTKMAQRDPGTTVLTPHPLEAARLLETTTALIEQDRFQAAQSLCEKWNAVVLLKGAGSVLSRPVSDLRGSPLVVISYGCNVLAKAGAGDVLCGLIGALWAQGLPASVAAETGSTIHGFTSRWLRTKHGNSLTPSIREFTECLPSAVRALLEGYGSLTL